MGKFKVIVGLKNGTWKAFGVCAKTRNYAVTKVCHKYLKEIEFVCGVEFLEDEESKILVQK